MYSLIHPIIASSEPNIASAKALAKSVFPLRTRNPKNINELSIDLAGSLKPLRNGE